MGSATALRLGHVSMAHPHFTPTFSEKQWKLENKVREAILDGRREERRREGKQKIKKAIKKLLGKIILSHSPFLMFVKTETRSKCCKNCSFPSPSTTHICQAIRFTLLPLHSLLTLLSSSFFSYSKDFLSFVVSFSLVSFPFLILETIFSPFLFSLIYLLNLLNLFYSWVSEYIFFCHFSLSILCKWCLINQKQYIWNFQTWNMKPVGPTDLYSQGTWRSQHFEIVFSFK